MKALNEFDFTFDDVMKVANGLSNVATGAKNNNAGKYSYSSIAKAASKLIAVFPILASRTVSKEAMNMVSKYIEQISCQFFMLALQQANISTARDGISYLKQFHQNLNIGDDNTDAIIAAMQSWIDAYNQGTAESATAMDYFADQLLEAVDDPFMMQSDPVEIKSTDLRDLMHMMNENANIEFYDTKLNNLSIDDYVTREFADGKYSVSVSPYTSINEVKAYKASRQEREKQEENRHAEQRQKESNRHDEERQREENRHNERMHQESNRHNEQRKREENRKAEADRKYYDDQMDKYDKYNAEENNRRAALVTNANVKILKDQDIKKMNNAVPSILIVKFYRQGDLGSDVSTVATEFLIGVKAKIVPVTTSEILRRIMNDNKDGQKFLKFMRVITGELKASDVMLGLSRVTDDVLSYKTKGARGEIWTLLQNRAVAAKQQLRQGQHNDFSAITTVVISQQDADELYHEENFDINNPKNAIHFMKSYNLMGFAIVDDSNEVLHLLMDNGSKYFEDISYTMLERETSDGTYKKLINLMAASR